MAAGCLAVLHANAPSTPEGRRRLAVLVVDQGWSLRRAAERLTGDPTRLGLQKPDQRLFETHPVVNSMLLHHLQHDDVVARPGIRRAHDLTVEFADGTEEEFDVILMATGYRHRVPVAQEYFGDEQHPDLYLNCCSREHTGLFGVGFIETNSGAYHLFDRQAHLLAAFIDEQRTGTASAREFDRLRRMDYPDLSGGLRFDSSPRHRGYVDADAYRRCNAPSVRILLDAIGSLENGGPDRRRHYGGACDQRLNGFRAHSQQVERSS